MSNQNLEQLSDKEITEALSTLANECFPAMSVANSLSGKKDKNWMIIRQFSGIDLINEAQSRGIRTDKIIGNVDEKPLAEALWAKEHIKNTSFSYSDYLNSLVQTSEGDGMQLPMS